MQPFFRYSGGLIVVTESPNFRDGIKCALYTIISYEIKICSLWANHYTGIAPKRTEIILTTTQFSLIAILTPNHRAYYQHPLLLLLLVLTIKVVGSTMIDISRSLSSPRYVYVSFPFLLLSEGTFAMTNQS